MKQFSIMICISITISFFTEILAEEKLSKTFKGKPIIERLIDGKTKRFLDGEVLIILKDVSFSNEFKRKLKTLFPNYSIIREFDQLGFGIIKVSSNWDILEVANNIIELDFVKYVSPHFILREAATPNDVYFQNYQNEDFSLMNFPLAWEIEKGSDNIKIGIIDSGIDLDHPDLENIILGNDHIENDNIPQDDRGHGTAVIGVIGAITNNSFGMASTLWDKTIIVEKIVDSDGDLSPSDYYDAVQNLINNHQVRIINASIQDLDNAGLEDFYNNIADFAALNNCLLILAAGNEGQISYMARSDEVLAVGVSNLDDPAYSHGLQMDISAHGKQIFSTYYDGGYADYYRTNKYNSGTSFSTPFITGVAGLVLSQNPSLTYIDLKQIMIESTDDIQSTDIFGNWIYEPGWDEYTGYGKVNSFKAVTGLRYNTTASSANLLIENLLVGDYIDFYTTSLEYVGRVDISSNNILNGKFAWNGLMNDGKKVATTLYLYKKNGSGNFIGIGLLGDTQPPSASNIEINSDKSLQFELSDPDEMARVSVFIFNENEDFLNKDIDNVLSPTGTNNFTLTTDLAYNYSFKLVLIDIAGNVSMYIRTYDRPMTPHIALSNYFHKHCSNCVRHIHPRIRIFDYNSSILDHFKIYRRINSGNWQLLAETSSDEYLDLSIEVFPRGEELVEYRVETVSIFQTTSFPSNIVNTWFDNQSKTVHELIPSIYSLNFNYPNPFNPVTQIKFGLPEKSNIQLVVYDLLGREIVTLKSGTTDAGWHSIQWGGYNNHGIKVPSGIYIYTLTAESLESDKTFVETKKMVLLK